MAALAMATAAAHADYPATVLSHGPLHYWRFNENIVVPAGDKADNLGTLGAAADGYYVGAVAHSMPGALASGSDTAAGFDTTPGTAVSVPYSATLNPSGAFTVEAWLNPNADTTTANPTCALASGQFGSPRSGWLIYQVDTGWNFRMYNQNDLATSVSITGGPTPIAGTWYHVVAVYDGTNATVYVNGTQRATAVPTGYVPSAGGPFVIGARSDSSFLWNGTADEVALYDRALSATEIDAHFRNGTSASPSTPYQQLVLTAAPLAYYRLNEPAYTPPDTLPTARNLGSAGTDGDGSYHPGINAQAAGPRPPAFSGFETGNNGLGANGTVGHVGTFASLNDLPAFTLAGWLRRGDFHSGRGGYFGQNDLLEFGDADSGANIEVWINAYGTNIKIPFPFRNNEWGMLAIVADGSSVTLYTNGVASTTVTQSVESYGSSADYFNIAGGGIFNTSGDYFLGGIDEVAVFDKALTPTQVLGLYHAANIAPSILAQPSAPNRDIFEGNAVTLSVGATGTPPLRYQWRRNGEDLMGSTSAELSFAAITIADAGSYDVVVSNDHGSVTSSPVTLTVRPADTVPPVLQYAAGSETLDRVRVWFSEPLDAASAQSPANYQVSGGLAVVSATLSAPPGNPGDNIVVLTTAPQSPGTTYTLNVTNVKDQSAPGNTVAPGSSVTFSSWALAQGYLKFEHFDGISGAADADLTRGLSDPRVVAGTPTTSGYIHGRFDTRTIFPDDSHETYLARISGWISPTESGDYYFFLGSDDAGRLYLSPNEIPPNPETDTPICIETDCCGAFAEPESGDPATTASPISLQAGRRYAVLAFLKEGGGGDHLEVAWRKSTDTTPAASLPRIPGQFLYAYVDPNADLEFTQPPTDEPATLPRPLVTFASADFTLNDGGYTVENTDPEPPGPWFHDSGRGQWFADGGESGCSGPYNSQLISPALVVPEDDEVTLTFSHRYSFEGDNWDGGQVRISVNGGAFTSVDPDAFTENGYATGTIQGNGTLNGQRAFNGDSPGYANGTFITSSVILGTFKKNDTIVVRFVGAWDDCTTASTPGWAIKGVQLAYGHAARASTFEAKAIALRQGTPTPFSYQWQRDDGAGFKDIPDATAATYRIFPVAADLNARFRVVAGVPGKSIASDPVKLIEGGSAPEIAISRSGASVVITFTGRLQSATDPAGPYSDVTGASSPHTVPATTDPRFFRSTQ